MLDINGGEFLVILLVAVIVIGPSRLPGYAEELGRIVRRARHYLRQARERVGDELGEDAQDIDWEALDPRRYDPRRIVREALLDPDSDPAPTNRSAPATHHGNGSPAPYRTSAVPTSAAPPSAASAAAGKVPEATAAPATAATPAGTGTAGTVTDPSPAAVPFDDEAT